MRSTAERDTLFPAPATNQRVQNLETGRLERYDGVQWIADSLQQFSVDSFGGVPDDATDNAPAIAAALSALRAAPGLGELVFSAGTYRYSGTLDFSDIPVVRGAGRSATTLKPTAALAFGADAITYSAVDVAQCTLQDFTLDGVLTTNTTISAVHLTNGENLTLHRVGVVNFDTNNSLGLVLDDVIFPRFVECFFGTNYVNIDIGTNATPSFPTMVRFHRCETRSAVASGLRIRQVFDMLWHGGKIEANLQEGVIARPGTGQVVQDVTLYHAYMENNYGANTSQYGAFFDDSAGGSIGNIALVRCRINGGPATEKAAYFNNVQGWTIDGVFRPQSTGAFKAEGSLGYGWVDHWLSTTNGDITVSIDDVLGQAQHDEQWKTFTPSLSGGGTLAVSSVVATTARIKKKGRTSTIDLNVSFTIATSNSTNVNLAMPLTLAIAKEMWIPCLISEGGGAMEGGLAHLIASGGGTTITFSKLDGSNWANGANNAIHAQLIVETT